MVGQYVGEHTKAITAILVDRSHPHIIHTAGKDCLLLSFDLKKERRINSHTVRARARARAKEEEPIGINEFSSTPHSFYYSHNRHPSLPPSSLPSSLLPPSPPPYQMREGSFTGLTQRVDGEEDLITCDAHGQLLFWDKDYRQPVMVRW